jgi:hypothetical protein
MTQKWVGERSVGYTNARENVPERRSDLCPSEKELLERRSGAFRHKNTTDYHEDRNIHPTPTE